MKFNKVKIIITLTDLEADNRRELKQEILDSLNEQFDITEKDFSMEVLESFNYEDIEQGDLVDFGGYGKLYVCHVNYSENKFWVTDIEEDRNNRDARGWSIYKSSAQKIIEKNEDEDGEDEEEE